MKNFLLVILLLWAGALLACPQTASADPMPPVVINELMWMGSSMSSSDEWIELRNTTTQQIDLAGWRLARLSNGNEVAMLTISSGTIPAGGYFVIANDPAATSRLAVDAQLVDSSMSIVNSKLQITLYDAANTLVDRADDGVGAPLAGDYQSGAAWKSMERNPFGADGTQKTSWHTASASVGFDDQLKEYGTPGAENSNTPPSIVVNAPTSATVSETAYFDASDTTDPEGGVVTILWNFGDGGTASGMTAEHTYTSAGTYHVVTTASDGALSAMNECDIVVTAPQTAAPSPAPATTPVTTTPATPQPTSPKTTSPATPVRPATPLPDPTSLRSGDIVLNEILPNPTGSDEEGEFLELRNIGKTAVDLDGWKITNTTKEYVLSSSTILSAGDVRVFFRKETGIALKNSGKNELFLVDPFGNVQNGVAYDLAPEGKSFSRTDVGSWQWTDPTPGEMNHFSEEKTSTTNSTQTTNTEAVPLVTIDQLARLPLRTKILVRGVMLVAPGTFSRTFFYISDGKRGVQVFSSKGTFPELAIGDAVEIHGTVGEASGERKVNIQTDEDVTVTGDGNEPEPLPFSEKLPTGSLVSYTGTVSSKRGSLVALTSADGTAKLSIPQAVDIDSERFSKDAAVSFIAVWRVTKDGGRLYLRSVDDVEASGEVKAAETTTTTPVAKTVSAATATPQTVAVTKEASSLSSKIATMLPLFLLAAAGGYWWWKRRTSAA
ncbi:MAG: lamin tail domain-containing protein [bacterium]